MHNRFDHVGKKILRGTLAPGGAVAGQLEIPSADAQAVDTFFEPDPSREAERRRIGLLGRMAEGPTMFELFHDPPGLDELRACFRKQLGLDHSRVLEAAKGDEHRRPPFPRLCVITTGRPERVLGGYGFSPTAGFPAGFYDRDEADACGIVVLRELPRVRETLILRLMAAGAVLNEALAELDRLPADAWERAVAIPPLVEARFKIPQDVADEAEREFLMSTQDLYEEWKQKTEQAGVERGIEHKAKQDLLELYETRFGAIPAELRAAIQATHDEPTLHAWFKLAITRSAEEIAAAIHASQAS
jgi:hypothetical protein